ncbi:MAG: A/G-specific adenine glycosylase [Candidatus Omnitrophota bacterium]
MPFRKNLLAWYRQNARDLPWRTTRDPYKIWISEVMLQQTAVNAVIPYYQKWIRVFPTVEKVASASLPRILRMWQGLGYYKRAKNIHRASRILVRQYAGKLPVDPMQLRSLPGFGPYTTGAVASIAFGVKHSIIDANVRRVCMRLLALKGRADTSQDRRIEDFLNKILPNNSIGLFNQALMELGALLCRSKEPQCIPCPVRRFCLAYRRDLQDVIPVVAKRVVHKIEAVVALLENKGRIFIQQRPSTGLFADLWEFPGGKINKGESIRQALAHELKEELNVCLRTAEPFVTVQHAYTQFQVRLHAWRCSVVPLPRSDRTHKWVRLRELTYYAMPSGSAKIVECLL